MISRMATREETDGFVRISGLDTNTTLYLKEIGKGKYSTPRKCTSKVLVSRVLTTPNKYGNDFCAIVRKYDGSFEERYYDSRYFTKDAPPVTDSAEGDDS